MTESIIEMNTFLRNTISKLYDAVSATIVATRDALAERLWSVHETASILYNRMMGNIEYGRERLKYILENEPREEEEETTEQKKQQPEDKIDLTAIQNERALKGPYRGFIIL